MLPECLFQFNQSHGQERRVDRDPGVEVSGGDPTVAHKLKRLAPDRHKISLLELPSHIGSHVIEAYGCPIRTIYQKRSQPIFVEACRRFCSSFCLFEASEGS